MPLNSHAGVPVTPCSMASVARPVQRLLDDAGVDRVTDGGSVSAGRSDQRVDDVGVADVAPLHEVGLEQRPLEFVERVRELLADELAHGQHRPRVGGPLRLAERHADLGAQGGDAVVSARRQGDAARRNLGMQLVREHRHRDTE